ncbi:putative two-component response regulator [Caenibius tardaugens NBRC 16725]|uniref:Putative two-component response regulator n=1 Tax=Caenibius tardaugens NBRC 16725 TaxID=1219035 RepID=U2ZWF5_9SPHN|nr:response regulator transcription factor [Caenibius tardaugens]AZI37733.1 DNA-binding response regulator [Caenibius tardaugens NBRC 16725]GAD49709.1 putative two-component response regulator [Caenibius tardaugens NBRC 16725]
MRILLAEDDTDTAQFIETSLGELSHVVKSVGTGDAALRIARSESWDVIILDRMLPELDGLTLLKAARSCGVTTPVLMLTALGRIEDRVDGLDAGADDYLVKPFAPSELVARVQALGRRYTQSEIATKLLAGPLELDLIAREIRRDGRLVLLQPRELRLLEVLMRHAGEFVTRAMLLEDVWDFHFDPQTKLIETHMSRLRAKLNEGGLPDLIETVRGSGYRVRAV